MYRGIRERLFPTFYEKEKYLAYREQKILNARQAGIDEANKEDLIIYDRRKEKYEKSISNIN